MQVVAQTQTIVTKIEDNLSFMDEKDENFIQTPHDSAVSDCVDSLIKTKCQVTGIIPLNTEKFLITVISYVEPTSLPKIETFQPHLVVPEITK